VTPDLYERAVITLTFGIDGATTLVLAALQARSEW
jgi:hypothetical protein